MDHRSAEHQPVNYLYLWLSFPQNQKMKEKTTLVTTTVVCSWSMQIGWSGSVCILIQLDLIKLVHLDHMVNLWRDIQQHSLICFLFHSLPICYVYYWTSGFLFRYNLKDTGKIEAYYDWTMTREFATVITCKTKKLFATFSFQEKIRKQIESEK